MDYKIKKQYRRDGYDYSQDGFYFITICTKNRVLIFGDIKNEKVILSGLGEIADYYWREIPKHFSFIKLHEYAIMPNHVHGIIQINNNDQIRTGQCPVPTNEYKSNFGRIKSKSISSIISSYKSIVTKKINLKHPNFGFAWQDRFYDRIIRDEEELVNIRNYIIKNPEKWEFDRNNPDNL